MDSEDIDERVVPIPGFMPRASKSFAKKPERVIVIDRRSAIMRAYRKAQPALKRVLSDFGEFDQTAFQGGLFDAFDSDEQTRSQAAANAVTWIRAAQGYAKKGSYETDWEYDDQRPSIAFPRLIEALLLDQGVPHRDGDGAFVEGVAKKRAPKRAAHVKVDDSDKLPGRQHGRTAYSNCIRMILAKLHKTIDFTDEEIGRRSVAEGKKPMGRAQ